jgi:hypothetical protein
MAAATLIEEQSNIKAQSQPRLPIEKKGHFRRVQLIWAGIVVFLTLFGGLAGAYSLRPQINVTASPSLNKNAPFEPLLTITNAGLSELYDVIFDCYRLEERQMDESRENLQATIKNHIDKEPGNNIAPEAILRPQNPIVRTCAMSTEVPGSHIISVATTLHMSFRPSFWPSRVSKFARFKSRKDPSGQIQWIPDPQDDPYSHQ